MAIKSVCYQYTAYSLVCRDIVCIWNIDMFQSDQTMIKKNLPSNAQSRVHVDYLHVFLQVSSEKRSMDSKTCDFFLLYVQLA